MHMQNSIDTMHMQNSIWHHAHAKQYLTPCTCKTVFDTMHMQNSIDTMQMQNSIWHHAHAKQYSHSGDYCHKM